MTLCRHAARAIGPRPRRPVHSTAYGSAEPHYSNKEVSVGVEGSPTEYAPFFLVSTRTVLE
jgi:hypothetical protein